MSIRTFHVEITFTKIIEVKVAPGDIPDDEDVEDWVIEEALLTYSSGKGVIDDDYQVETVEELAEKAA